MSPGLDGWEVAAASQKMFTRRTPCIGCKMFSRSFKPSGSSVSGGGNISPRLRCVGREQKGMPSPFYVHRMSAPCICWVPADQGCRHLFAQRAFWQWFVFGFLLGGRWDERVPGCQRQSLCLSEELQVTPAGVCESVEYQDAGILGGIVWFHE